LASGMPGARMYICASIAAGASHTTSGAAST
jgi:hypothetical protein